MANKAPKPSNPAAEKVRRTVNERLAKQRRKAGYTEKELGDVVDVDARTIKRWEGRAEPKTMPTLSEARLIADRLGVSLDWLTGNQTSAVAEASSIAAWAERERRQVTERIDRLVADLTQAKASLLEEARVERVTSRGLSHERAQQHG